MNDKLLKNLKKVHYNLYSMINLILPKCKKMVFIYDSPFMRQNCWALYKFLMNNGYQDKYKIIYYSEKYNDHYGALMRSGVVTNPLKGWLLHLLSKYTFYEYHNFKFCCKPGKKQKTVYLTHGMPLKNYGYLVENPDHPYENDYSYLLMTSEYYIPIMKKILGCNDNQIYIGGMPRCDQLYNSMDFTWIMRNGKKTVLWMPTFRQSETNKINDSNCDFPLLNRDSILELDSILEEKQVFLIIKPHPFQKRINWLYDVPYKNIKVLLNEELESHNAELYELIGNVDMLITDYSSVYSDYLLTNNPIVFAIDDYEVYKQNRGFVDNRLIDELPGPIINDFQNLVKCISSIESIKHDYESMRKKAQSMLSPKMRSDSFSRDLCEFLNIKKESGNA